MQAYKDRYRQAGMGLGLSRLTRKDTDKARAILRVWLFGRYTASSPHSLIGYVSCVNLWRIGKLRRRSGQRTNATDALRFSEERY